MELTRRDAIAALTSLGAAAGAIGLGQYHSEAAKTAGGEEQSPDDETVVGVMTSVARVVYPSAVDGVEEFVTTFLSGRLQRPDHGQGVRASVGALDERARLWYDQSVTDLDRQQQDQLLREIGVDTADEDPSGTTAERIRYYVVNELLLALYASPKGGELVGIENPQGHPGGTESYQRGPQ